MRYEKNPRTYRSLSMMSAALFVFMLAIAVFGWGLHSKLSLYRLPIHTTSTSSPVAKLLSERERPADRAQALEIAPADMAILVMATALVVTTPIRSIRHLPAADEFTLVSCILALKGPTLRRPPPAYLA